MDEFWLSLKVGLSIGVCSDVESESLYWNCLCLDSDVSIIIILIVSW